MRNLLFMSFILCSLSSFAGSSYESPFQYVGSSIKNSTDLNHNLRNDLNRLISIFSKKSMINSVRENVVLAAEFNKLKKKQKRSYPN